jgi:hypothetical protein
MQFSQKNSFDATTGTAISGEYRSCACVTSDLESIDLFERRNLLELRKGPRKASITRLFEAECAITSSDKTMSGNELTG